MPWACAQLESEAGQRELGLGARVQELQIKLDSLQRAETAWQELHDHQKARLVQMRAELEAAAETNSGRRGPAPYSDEWWLQREPSHNTSLRTTFRSSFFASARSLNPFG